MEGLYKAGNSEAWYSAVIATILSLWKLAVIVNIAIFSVGMLAVCVLAKIKKEN